jgi:hypothetical protein
MTMTRRWLRENASGWPLRTAGGLGLLAGSQQSGGERQSSDCSFEPTAELRDTRRPAYSFITSNDLFFVRSHIHTPRVRQKLTLAVDIVERPLVLRLELEALPR